MSVAKQRVNMVIEKRKVKKNRNQKRPSKFPWKVGSGAHYLGRLHEVILKNAITPIHLMNNKIGVGSTTDVFLEQKTSMTQKPIRSEDSYLQPEVVDNFITMRFQPNIANKCPQSSTQTQ